MKLLFFSLVVLFAFFSSFLYAEAAESDLLLNEGIKLYELGKFQEAISYFDQVLEINPNNATAIAKKGDSLFELGNPREAVIYFEKLLIVAPYHADTSGRLYIDKLIEIEPNNVEALFKRGKSLAIFSNYLDIAISYFDRALEIEPSRSDILSSKGESLLNSEKFIEANSLFDRALEIEPNNLDAIRGKGAALAELGKFEESHSYIDKALEINPNDGDALIKKGDTYRLQENYRDALIYFHKALEVEPENFLADNKFRLIHGTLIFKKFDGFVETTVHDSQGNLVSHLKINKVFILDHPLAENIINEWNVTKTINRNGTNYEVRQYETSRTEAIKIFHGGVSNYGIELHKKSMISVDYWFYLVDEGDISRSVITAFTPIV